VLNETTIVSSARDCVIGIDPDLRTVVSTEEPRIRLYTCWTSIRKKWVAQEMQGS
jgi:hypothetical protein